MSRQQSYNPSASMHVHQADAANIPPFHTIDSEPRFLRSDYVPSEIEISLLKDVLKEGGDEMKRYKEDIRKANSTVRQCQAAISARRRIPVEIWEMVFSTLCLSLHEYSFDIEHHSPLLGLPASILSQVCSRWRMIAKGLPRLWSSIKVNLYTPPHNVTIPLNVYFSNSEGYPLKLQIEATVSPSNPFRGLDSDVWRVLSRHIHRSRELTIAVSRTLPPIQHLTFPNLESFYEKGVLLDGSPWLGFWQAIQEAPKLAMVSSSRFRPSIPFSQLTTWEVPYLVEVNNFLDVLQRCKRLVSLTLLHLSNSGSPVAAREVELPSLRRLSVSVYRDEIDPLSSILQSLVMPSLETCKISFGIRTLPPALLTMVRRFSTTLKQITINVLPGGTRHWLEKYLIDMLQTACELTHFELYVEDFNVFREHCSMKVLRPLFDSMVSTLLLKLRDDHHTFLPKLDTLSFHFPYITLNRQLVMRILEAVSARQRTLYPLTEFRLTCIRRVEGFLIEPEFVERIQMLKKSGIKVVVEYR